MILCYNCNELKVHIKIHKIYGTWQCHSCSDYMECATIHVFQFNKVNWFLPIFYFSNPMSAYLVPLFQLIYTILQISTDRRRFVLKHINFISL